MAALLTQARQLAGGGGIQGVSGPSALRKARRLHVSNLPADIGVTKESISAFFNSAMEMAQLAQSAGPCVVDVQYCTQPLTLFPIFSFDSQYYCILLLEMTRGCTGTRWASASPLWSSALQLKPPPACSSTASPSVRALPRAAHNPYNPNRFPLSFPQVPAPSPSPAPVTTSRAAAQSWTHTPRSFTLQLHQWAAAQALRLLLFFLLWRHSPSKNSLLFRWALRMLRAACRRAMRPRLLLLLLLLLHLRVRIIPRRRPPPRLLRH
jgi:hypothetical protein